jgi:hypothetical protein
VDRFRRDSPLPGPGDHRLRLGALERTHRRRSHSSAAPRAEERGRERLGIRRFDDADQSNARLRRPLRGGRNPAEGRGSGRIVEFFAGWKTAVPDAAGTVTGALASGNKADLEVTWKGTHTGPLVTLAGTNPASGKGQEVPTALSSPSRATRSRRATITSTR